MEPRDWVDLDGGVACDACGEPVPSAQIRVLAHRDDVLFAEIPCPTCGSVGLAIVVVAEVEAEPPAPLEPPADPSAPPIGPDDVLDMHLFLAGWSGDLRSLVRPPRRGRSPEAA